MIFSTYGFIFVFLPLVFLAYSVPLKFGKTTLSKWVLVLASFFFYAFGSGDFFPFFVASVLFNYVLGQALSAGRERYGPAGAKLILVVGLLGNIALLGYYKYTDFLIFNFNFFFGAEVPYRNVLLPIGISFFTFQLIAYLVDSYQGLTRDYNFLNYLLFITFFPQLIVGPIVHHKDVVPQYEHLKPAHQNSGKIAAGVFLFSIGCAKKLMMADPLTVWAQRAFDNTAALTMIDSWAASVSYTLSYYFDLSGYADMAIGLGLMFGIMLPINFESPYKARNFADYWRRWHITLSRFLSDYVFRGVYKKGGGSANFYWAIFVTFLVSGFWHGAGWTFVVWGILNGIFVIFSHMMKRSDKRLPFLAAWALTFLGVVAVRILFVSGTFRDAINVFTSAVDLDSLSLAGNHYVALKQPLYILAGMALVFFFPSSNQLRDRFRPTSKFAFATAGLMVLSVLNMSNVMGFLYFQF